MYKNLSRIILILLFFISTNFSQSEKLDLSQPLQFNPAVKKGKFQNGLSYYILKNKKPESRAELRLAVNAGAMQEDESQNGLAHFCEHMAFNGTEKYKKQEIIDFLESIGMKFGPEINAYTSKEETVYKLQLPTDSLALLDKGFDILNQWAFHVSYDHEEIDKERGVVHEEWRLGRGANQRMRNKHNKVILSNSKYAVHDVIGKEDIILNSDYETIKSFYKNWYRPDLMAVVAVGDFDPDQVFDLIKKYFDTPPTKKKVRKRNQEQVPPTEGTKFSFASDKEATQSTFQIIIKDKPESSKSLSDFRETLVKSFFGSMFNQRIGELTMTANPPFINAYANSSNWTRTCGSYFLSGIVKDNGIETGLQALLIELKKVREFGFLPEEFERTKKSFLSSWERYYNERDKIYSASHASMLVNSFLTDNFVTDIAYRYDYVKKLINTIQLDEINKLAALYSRTNNRVITVSLPEKESINKIEMNDLQKILNKVEKNEVKKHTENLVKSDLINYPLTPGKITNEKYFEKTNVTELDLSNGVKIVVKPTDFKNDEILLSAFSPGGSSLASDEIYNSASISSGIIVMGGVGNYSMIDLSKINAGKQIRVYPWISQISEGINGRSTPKDFEHFLKLVNLYFNSPRKDTTAFLSVKNRYSAMLKNQEANPRKAFQDTLQRTLTSYHPKTKIWTDETVQKLNLDQAYEFYKDRFADAGDFTFIFVGNIDIQTVKPLFEKYLGSLPNIKRTETWKDLGIRVPKGVIKKEVNKGIDPKSNVSLNFSGDLEYDETEIYYFTAMTDYLNIRLRELIREDNSGTYGIGVRGMYTKTPYSNYRISINFGCAPERANELIGIINDELKNLQTTNPDDSYIIKVKQKKLKAYEKGLKENSYWKNVLYNSYWENRDQNRLFEYPEIIEKLNAEKISELAKKFFDFNNYIEVVSYPEKK